ncbi:MAG: amidohydrolase, partial [Bacteroidota bacterium]
MQDIRRFFEEAKAYVKQANPETKNLKFESMKGLFDKKQSLFIRTGSVRTIQDAVLFAESAGVSPVIVGGEESWRITDFLKSH